MRPLGFLIVIAGLFLEVSTGAERVMRQRACGHEYNPNDNVRANLRDK